ncbi:hypothetical protein ACS0TY_009179 [Phlomoides rotata]
MPLVYFYPSDSKLSHSEKSNHLKNSLSQVLPIFHPLAGRLSGDLHVDCNDAGAPFFEAQTNCDLSQAITNPIITNMNKFLPFKLDDIQNLCMAVQLTYFRCGGAAVGLVMSHKIADAFSFLLFANTWAAVSRGGGAPSRPDFDGAAVFPPRDVSGFKTSAWAAKEDELTAKIFTFPSSKIAALKEKYSGGGGAAAPTRVEALSAFIWTRFISATETEPDPNKIYTVIHAVNLRARVDPPLSERHFGNFSRFALTTPAVEDGRVMDGDHELLRKFREAIRAVDGAYVAGLRDGEKHVNLMRERTAQTVKGELVTFSFTSLCRFPLYEADFGWGKPVWVGSAMMTYNNLVTFMDPSSGDGLEAWVIMKKEDMRKFEADFELQKFIL